MPLSRRHLFPRGVKHQINAIEQTIAMLDKKIIASIIFYISICQSNNYLIFLSA
jgi:hypothetical protein